MISTSLFYCCKKVFILMKIWITGENSIKLLLADPFENFHNMCLEICELDPACFLTAPGLEFQRSLKKSKVRLDLLTDFDMLLMVEKGIRGGICQVIHSSAKANKRHKILR